ncbi:MAG: hypothetical protein AB1716_14605 [Planctomycetota bacterium]
MVQDARRLDVRERGEPAAGHDAPNLPQRFPKVLRAHRANRSATTAPPWLPPSGRGEHPLEFRQVLFYQVARVPLGGDRNACRLALERSAQRPDSRRRGLFVRRQHAPARLAVSIDVFTLPLIRNHQHPRFVGPGLVPAYLAASLLPAPVPPACDLAAVAVDDASP